MIIATQRVHLLSADEAHAQAYADFYRRNAEHLRPWEPPLSPEAFDPERHASRLRSASVEFGLRSARFGIFGHGDETLLGFVNLSSVIRGAWWSATLGYALDADVEGRGIMSEAAAAVVEFGFSKLRLHRIAANYRPENVRSAAVLARLDFTIEGRAPDYLFIDGAWRDHILTSRRNPQRGSLSASDVYGA